MKLILLILPSAYAAMCVLLFLVQERFIFQDIVLPDDHQFEFDRPFSENSLSTSGGGSINSLYFKADSPKGLIIYFHGNAGNLEGWGRVAQKLSEYDYDVAIMDYRGFGKSKGKRSEEAIHNDALEFYEHVKGDYQDSEIILFGRSLGTGIAAYVASRHTPGKVILETPYTTFVNLVHNHMPLFPTRFLLRYHFKTSYLEEVDSPVYIIHGTQDHTVPVKFGRALHKSLGSKSTLTIIEEGSHNDLSEFPQYWSFMDEILN